MSGLAQFFESRHKGKKNEDENTQIATIFSTPFEAPKAPNPLSGPVKVNKHTREEDRKLLQKQAMNILDEEEAEEQDGQQNKTRRKKPRHKKTKANLGQNGDNAEEEAQNLDATVFVGNIPLDSTHKALKKHFEQFGNVLKAWFRSIPVEQSKIPKKGLHILKKYQEGADSMNAYVKFQKEQSAKSALSLNTSVYEGKNIRVTLCKSFDIDYETTIFIGNLPLKINDQQLWDTFKVIGGIKSVRIIRNKSTLQGIGIAYVRFETKELMRKAIQEMNGKKVGDRQMRIKKAVSKERLQKKIQKTIERKQNKGKSENDKDEITGKGVPVRNKNEGQFSNKKESENNQNESNSNNFGKTKPISKLVKSSKNQWVPKEQQKSNSRYQGNKKPQTDYRSPQTDNRPPRTDYRSPRTDNRPPKTDYRSPRTDNRPQRDGDRAPRIDNLPPRDQPIPQPTDAIRTKYGFHGKKITFD